MQEVMENKAEQLVDAPLDVLYRDERLMAVNKVAGLAVHSGTGHEQKNLVEQLRRYLLAEGLSCELLGTGAEARTGLAPAHRLDVWASGVVLFGLDEAAKQALSSAFEARKVRKTYWVLVHGRSFADGVINRPLPNQHGELCEARTKYKRMAMVRDFSLLMVRTEGGRAHQIRRHLEAIGHPVAGDARYAGELRAGRFHHRFAVSRMMLHARQVVFEHPFAEKRLAVVASPGEDWVKVLSSLGIEEA